MKKLFFLLPVIWTLLVFSGCNKQTVSEICPTGSWDVVCWTNSEVIDHSDFTWAVDAVLLAIKNDDLLTLSTFVGPQWLRFSPYEYVNIWTDIVLTTAEVANWLAMSSTRTRGVYDGSGEPIDLWIGQYFGKFVNDADYTTAPEITYNQSTQRGNMINNIAQVYSGKQWADFYFPWFDPQYEGMDRKSLTLVFEDIGGQWNLIGIVHGQRTI